MTGTDASLNSSSKCVRCGPEPPALAAAPTYSPRPTFRIRSRISSSSMVAATRSCSLGVKVRSTKTCSNTFRTSYSAGRRWSEGRNWSYALARIVPMMMLPAISNRRNAPSVIPPAPISRSMSSSQITESLSITSLASKSARAVLEALKAPESRIQSRNRSFRTRSRQRVTRCACVPIRRYRDPRFRAAVTGRDHRWACGGRRNPWSAHDSHADQGDAPRGAVGLTANQTAPPRCRRAGQWPALAGAVQGGLGSRVVRGIVSFGLDGEALFEVGRYEQ